MFILRRHQVFMLAADDEISIMDKLSEDEKQRLYAAVQYSESTRRDSEDTHNTAVSQHGGSRGIQALCKILSVCLY